jgi:hypothetical protein
MAAPHMSGVAALCENHAGHTGTCAGKTPAQVIAELRSKASAYNFGNPAYGFTYDPAHSPLSNIYFGYLTGVFDTVAPDTSITAGPEGLTRSTEVSLQFVASESGTRFECTLDGSAWTPCASPQSLPSLAEGGHSLSVRAIDAAGNFDLTSATHSWTLDTTAPDTTIDSGPKRRTTSRSATFELSASEPGSRLFCKLDSRAWAECSSPKRLTRLSVGSHRMLVAASDSLGNVDATPAERTWTVLPTTDRIKSELRADVAGFAKRLRRFGIAKLVKRGSFTARGIDTLLGGKLSVALNGTPQGKAGVARKRVLAKGGRSVKNAGRYALKLKLTRQGKRLLRRDRSATVTLRISFRDSFGRTAASDKSLGLRR